MIFFGNAIRLTRPKHTRESFHTDTLFLEKEKMTIFDSLTRSTTDDGSPSLRTLAGGSSAAANNASSGRRVVRFNENAALLQQQIQDQKERKERSSVHQKHLSSSSSSSSSIATPSAAAASSAAAAAASSGSSTSSSGTDSVFGFFCRLFSGGIAKKPSAAPGTTTGSSLFADEEQHQSRRSAQQQQQQHQQSDNARIAGAAELEEAEYKTAMRIEQQKREMLSKQLGRSHASISGPELDTIARELSWRDLPPCPIFGMKLTEQGLYDSDVGRHFDADDLRDLINRTGKLEASSNLESESRLGVTAWKRVSELSIVAGIFTGGLVIGWFWGLKFWQGYAQAFPRKSVLLKHWHLRRNPDMEPIVIEALCQKHRVIFNVTNPRPMFFLTSGVVGVGMAIFGEVSRRRKDDFRDVNKFIIQRGQHYEGTMKWLFAVYYHHPVYKEAAAARKSRSLQTSTEWHPTMDAKTPNLNSRRSSWEDQFPNR